MGLVNDVENNGTAPQAPQVPQATAPATPSAPTAPTAPTAGATKAPAKTSKGGGIEALKNKGADIRKNLSEEDKAKEGSKQGALQFVCVLGDTSSPNNRTEQGDASIKSYKPCGARFKALEALKVPTVALKQMAKDGMDVDPASVQNIQWSEVPAGTDIDLNLYEVGMLLAQPEYRFEVNGGGRAVVVSPKTKADRLVPLVTLKYKDGKGSVKEGLVLVADKTETGYQVKAGFEKFSGLFNKPAASRSSSSASKNTDALANVAAAWLAIATGANN